MTLGDAITWGLIVVTGAVIIKNQNKIIMTNEELVARIDAQATKLTKIQTEIQALKDTINTTPNVPQVVVDAVDRVDAALQATDDMNEDTPTPPAE
jgi:hypothetical protein